MKEKPAPNISLQQPWRLPRTTRTRRGNSWWHHQTICAARLPGAAQLGELLATFRFHFGTAPDVQSVNAQLGSFTFFVSPPPNLLIYEEKNEEVPVWRTGGVTRMTPAWPTDAAQEEATSTAETTQPTALPAQPASSPRQHLLVLPLGAAGKAARARHGTGEMTQGNKTQPLGWGPRQSGSFTGLVKAWSHSGDAQRPLTEPLTESEIELRSLDAGHSTSLHLLAAFPSPCHPQESSRLHWNPLGNTHKCDL